MAGGETGSSGWHKARDGAEAPEQLPPEGGTPTRGFTDTDLSVGVPPSGGSLRGPSGPGTRKQGVVPRDAPACNRPPRHAPRTHPRRLTDNMPAMYFWRFGAGMVYDQRRRGGLGPCAISPR
jgi:hypothetical protein